MRPVDPALFIAYKPGPMPEEIVPRDDVRAALAARRELGEEFDDAVVESFARRIEERLGPAPPPARARRTDEEKRMSLALAIVSIGVGIPITAIALSGAGLAGLIVA